MSSQKSLTKFLPEFLSCSDKQLHLCGPWDWVRRSFISYIFVQYEIILDSVSQVQ